MQTENYTVNQLQLQSHIAKQQLRIEQSGYLPDIAVFGKQTLYAHGIQSNLVPRTMIGVGFTWNLFDGLAREKRIRQSKIAQQTLSIGQELSLIHISSAYSTGFILAFYITADMDILYHNIAISISEQTAILKMCIRDRKMMSKICFIY